MEAEDLDHDEDPGATPAETQPPRARPSKRASSPPRRVTAAFGSSSDGAPTGRRSTVAGDAPTVRRSTVAGGAERHTVYDPSSDAAADGPPAYSSDSRESDIPSVHEDPPPPAYSSDSRESDIPSVHEEEEEYTHSSQDHALEGEGSSERSGTDAGAIYQDDRHGTQDDPICGGNKHVVPPISTTYRIILYISICVWVVRELVWETATSYAGRIATGWGGLQRVGGICAFREHR